MYAEKISAATIFVKINCIFPGLGVFVATKWLIVVFFCSSIFFCLLLHYPNFPLPFFILSGKKKILHCKKNQWLLCFLQHQETPPFDCVFANTKGLQSINWCFDQNFLQIVKNIAVLQVGNTVSFWLCIRQHEKLTSHQLVFWCHKVVDCCILIWFFAVQFFLFIVAFFSCCAIFLLPMKNNFYIVKKILMIAVLTIFKKSPFDCKLATTKMFTRRQMMCIELKTFCKL